MFCGSGKRWIFVPWIGSSADPSYLDVCKCRKWDIIQRAQQKNEKCEFRGTRQNAQSELCKHKIMTLLTTRTTFGWMPVDLMGMTTNPRHFVRYLKAATLSTLLCYREAHDWLTLMNHSTWFPSTHLRIGQCLSTSRSADTAYVLIRKISEEISSCREHRLWSVALHKQKSDNCKVNQWIHLIADHKHDIYGMHLAQFSCWKN